MKFKLLITLLVALASGANQLLLAAPQESGYRFRAIAWNMPIPDALYKNGNEYVSMDLMRGILSSEQVINGDGQLVFYIEREDEKGMPKKVPFAEVQLLPLPMKNLVVVWRNSAGRFEALALPDAPDTPGPRQARLVNLVDRKLALNTNGNTQVIPAGESLTVSAEGKGVGIKIALEMENSEGWKLAAMNAIRVRPSTRVNVLIAESNSLATAPEDEGKEIVAKPLSLLVITDTIANPTE